VSSSKPAEPSPLPLTVLVADPSPHMATLVAGMLRTIKVREVREVQTAAAALAELARREYSVLVLDDGMKDIASVEFVRRLRASSTNPSHAIPIIMMSAAPGVSEIKAARDAGVTEFLRKPFAPRDIGARLNTIMNAPREFIAAPAYAGPDRRRRTSAHGGEDRRSSEDRAEDQTGS
jgi:two-component system chemotaxis response regulator CheY